MRIRPTMFAIVLALFAAVPALAQTKIADIQSNTFSGLRGLIVPPTLCTDVGNLVDGGILDVEGFGFITLNMAGESKGPGAGDVLAILVPNVAPFDVAYQQLGLVPVSLEMTARFNSGPGYFMAKQRKFEAGFPQYRVFFCNTSQATVQIAFFARKTLN
ncbi:MAG: hypothetical protein KBD01_13660 [Acidobacteria bacterium]|nr:hypothetical protein [Acidobacteriota bacterium]